MKKLIINILILIFLTIEISGQSIATFTVTGIPADSLENIGIRGSVAPLDWGKSIPLKKVNGVYSVTIDFSEVYDEVEFKFVRYTDDRNPSWENIQNRSISLSTNSDIVSTNTWNKEQIIDISKLKRLSPQQLLADFELIKTMVLDVHPGTYRYNTEKQISQALEELKSKFSQPLSTGEAYLAISKLTAQLKCDHTKAGFNNQNKVINSIIHYQKDKVPFTFRWIDNQMIVTHNASENKQLRKGTAIKCINGHPVEKIKKEILLYVGADGATDGNRSYKTEVNGYDFRYNAFDIFFPLLYPLNQNTIHLEIQDYFTKEISDIKVALLTREERAKILSERYPDFPNSRDDLWKFEILKDSIGLLTINSFGLNGWKAMTLDYKQFLAETFAKIKTKSIHHLIIDIRENTGGADEMSIALFSYLPTNPTYFKREGRTRYLTFPETLKPYIQTWGDNPWYFNLNPEKKEPSNGYYLFKENIESTKKSKNEIFNGQVYLLISAANTSLSFYTAYRFALQQTGTTIGQETGGNLNDINGGQILFLELPNSTIEIDFPVMGNFTIDPQPDTGVKPNVEVKVQRSHIANKKDPEIETVLKIINKYGTQ